MTIDLTSVRIFIRRGKTDLRKAVNGLLGIIEQGMSGEAFSGNVCLFCNKERKLLKALWWEKNGFWLNQKERYDLLVYKRFCRSAEQLCVDEKQGLLFNEEPEQPEMAERSGEEERGEVKSYNRKKAGRKAMMLR